MKDMLSNYVLGALACIVMGIAIIIRPHIIPEVLNTAVGVILIAWAAVGILRFIIIKATDSNKEASVFSLLGNLIILVAGIYVFINTDLLEKIVMLALGLYLICSGLPKVVSSFKLRSAGSDKWVFPLVTSLCTLILGIVVILCPSQASGTIMRVFGFVLTASGIVNFMSGFSATKAYKKIEKELAYAGGKGKDKRSTHAEDKANAVDVEEAD